MLAWHEMKCFKNVVSIRRSYLKNIICDKFVVLRLDTIIQVISSICSLGRLAFWRHYASVSLATSTNRRFGRSEEIEGATGSGEAGHPQAAHPRTRHRRSGRSEAEVESERVARSHCSTRKRKVRPRETIQGTATRCEWPLPSPPSTLVSAVTSYSSFLFQMMELAEKARSIHKIGWD